MLDSISEEQANQIAKKITSEYNETHSKKIVTDEELKFFDNMVLKGIGFFIDFLKVSNPDLNAIISHTFSDEITMKEYTADFGEQTFFYKLTFNETHSAYIEIEHSILFGLIDAPVPEGNFTPTQFQKQIIQRYVISPIIDSMFDSIGFSRETLTPDYVKCRCLNKNNFITNNDSYNEKEKGLLFQFLWNLKNNTSALTNMFIPEEFLNHIKAISQKSK